MNLSGLSELSAGRKVWENNFCVTLTHTTLHPHLTEAKKDELLQKLPHAEVRRRHDMEALKSNHTSDKFDSVCLAQMVRHGKPRSKDINGVVRHLQTSISLKADENCDEKSSKTNKLKAEPVELPAPPQEVSESESKKGTQSRRRYEVTAPVVECVSKEEDRQPSKESMARRPSSQATDESSLAPRSLRSFNRKLRQITGRTWAEAHSKVVPTLAPVVEKPAASLADHKQTSDHKYALSCQTPPVTHWTAPRPDPSAWLRKKAKIGKRDEQLVAQDMFVFRN